MYISSSEYFFTYSIEGMGISIKIDSDRFNINKHCVQFVGFNKTGSSQ